MQENGEKIAIFSLEDGASAYCLGGRDEKATWSDDKVAF